MSEDMNSLAQRRAETDPRPDKLAGWLDALEAADRRISPEHVTTRLEKLLAGAAHDGTALGSTKVTEVATSLPPGDEDSGPYEGQSLEGLLSGEICYVPEELLKVVLALDALRAAPEGAELFGEAAARAEFRRLMLVDRSGLAFAKAGADDARTLILPTVTADGTESRVVRRRPHSHRRPPKRGRWQAKVLVGVAAAVVAVGATALAGTLSSSGGHPAASRLNSGAASTPAVSAASGAHGVDGSGSPEPSAEPTQTGPTQSGNDSSPDQLCREYFIYLADSGRHGTPAAESALYRELSALAKGRGGVNAYCMRRLDLWEAPQGPGNSQGAFGSVSSNGQGQQGAGHFPQSELWEVQQEPRNFPGP